MLPPAAAAAKRKRKKVKPLARERDTVQTVRFAYSESATAIVPLVALQKGFLKKEGLNATGKPLKTGSAALSSVYGGTLDFGTTSNGRLVQWAAKGWNMKTVAVNNTGFLAVVSGRKHQSYRHQRHDSEQQEFPVPYLHGHHSSDKWSS